MDMAEKACWGLAAKINIWFGTWKGKVAGLLMMTIGYNSTCYLFMVYIDIHISPASYLY
jgi:hypothetical protein